MMFVLKIRKRSARRPSRRRTMRKHESHMRRVNEREEHRCIGKTWGLPTTNGATILAEAAFPTNSTQQYRTV
jgi:hypothetical protein